MKVLIDFTQIPIKKVGVGVYAKETFTRLLKNINENDVFYLLLQDDEFMFEDLYSSNCIPIRVKNKWFRKLPFRFLLEQFYIPKLVRKYNIDLIHSLHYSFPLIKMKCKRVITIHDLTFFIYPKLHTFVKRHFFKWFTRQSCKTNNILICVSESTAKDLDKFIPKSQDIRIVIPLAVSSNYNLNNNVLNQYGINSEYILFIGTLEPRKNIDKLIEAYSRCNNKDKYKLVIVGKKGWYYDSIFEKIKEFGLENQVIFTGFVTENDKWNLLHNATLFVYPSYYEGFGLPILEAMIMGIPVITSNISSMPEVAGNAAVLINPNDIEEISTSIDSVLDDKSMQNRMKELGIMQAKNYTWDNTALLTMNVYQNNSIQ